ncbi:HAD-IB family phosphatase [Candidatus Contubernalis alkaliaceticus]|uniref:HAD-IB family phosphatase n=1 Tax=Candidatus Contubernalis alkaliaceticus TaxID=338645 RepID=UPI001F4C3B9B|nr:HAD-IB family phosphatase [Candidatus Contubernalis alkalaceticus]UNC91784.1 HAD-IB family phosphatase [Candidatus Contubernalis alkalaceticus]
MITNNKVKLVAFDVDGTLTVEKSAWAYIHRKLGIWEDVGEKYLNQFRAGEITYAEFARLDALRWKGISWDRLINILEEISVMEKAKEAVEKIKQNHVEVALISSGLLPLVERVAHELEIKHFTGNELVVEEGILTGEAKVNVSLDVWELSKGAYLNRLTSSLNISPVEVAAVGDGLGDLDMFKAAGVPLLVNCCLEEREIILREVTGVLDVQCITGVPEALGFE